MAHRGRAAGIFWLILTLAQGAPVLADDPVRLDLMQHEDQSNSERKTAALAVRLAREADAMALDAVAQEVSGAVPHLPMFLRPSGLAYFELKSLVRRDQDGTGVATYIAQHSDETFECGEIAWSENDGSPQLQRHDRRFFDPAMLRDPLARQKLQSLGCL